MDHKRKADFTKHFGTPESYFEELPGKVQERLQKPAIRRFPLRVPRFVFALSFLALIAFLVKPSEEALTENLDNDVVVEYLMARTDLAFVEESYVDYVELTESDATIDYLIQENLDLNTIIKEL